MISYKYYMFKGGLHGRELILAYLEDVGGIVIQESRVGLGLVISLAVPAGETERLRELADALRAEVIEAPLVGSEIGIVTPSISRKHLPHPVCDIAEYIRRMGAKTNMIGLARGVGQRAQINDKEKEILEEHDAVIFVLGNFKHCLLKKKDVLRDLDVPKVVVGAPQMGSMPFADIYVGGLGRINHRLKSEYEIGKLREIAKAAEICIQRKREEQSRDPLAINPLLVMKALEKNIPEIMEQPSPMPLTLKVDGLRVKIPFDEYVQRVRDVAVGKYKLGEVAVIKKSAFGNHILIKIMPESQIGLQKAI